MHRMKQFIDKKILVTTSGWFYGADGKQYKAVHGTLKAVHEAGKTLGFIPNRSHANWFIEIGEMIIMGCQVMYVVQCDSVHTGSVTEWSHDSQQETGIRMFERPTAVYVVG